MNADRMNHRAACADLRGMIRALQALEDSEAPAEGADGRAAILNVAERIRAQAERIWGDLAPLCPGIFLALCIDGPVVGCPLKRRFFANKINVLWRSGRV